MPLIEWNDDLKTGFRPMDSEHRRLANLVNELHEYLVAGSSLTLIDAVFQQIAAHTVVHFRHEEKLMAEYGFPDLAAHREAHLELERQITELLQRIELGAPVFSLELVEFLKSWLVSHILTLDKAFGEYALKHGD